MIDLKTLRDNFGDVESSLKTRGYHLDKKIFFSIDDKRKSLQVSVEKLQADRKKLSAEFGSLKSSNQDTSSLKEIIDKNNIELDSKNNELQDLLTKLNDFLLDIPNIPDSSVPDGKD